MTTIAPVRLVLALCLAAACSAQFPAGQTPQADPQMVDLNIVAVDSHGQAVSDLKAGELQLTDNGKPQTIVFFHHRDSSMSVAPAPAPNEVSNRGRANIPRATLILFDMLNERFATRGLATTNLIRDLQSLESSDYLYLYCLSLDGRVVPLHGLPNPDAKPEPAEIKSWTGQIKPLMDRAMRNMTQLRPLEQEDPTYRIELTFNALDAVATQLSGVPGRKSLVWITDGVPVELGPNRSDTGEIVDFTPLIRRLSDTFDRSGVAIYPVRQVMMGSPDSMGGPGTSGLGSLETLNQFAGLTGGRPDAGKDIGSALRQALADMRTSYQVGYTPPPGNWDGKFHKLRITCARKGVRIQSKTGYYAWEEPPGARSEQAIESAAATTFDAAEIGLRATLFRAPGDPKVQLQARIEARDIVFVHTADRYDAQLRVGVAGLIPFAPPSRSKVVPMDLQLDPAAYEKALREGIPLVQDIPIPDAVQSLRLVVYDRGSNAVGSVTLAVPARSRPN